jgi:DNA-binding beta-propeller fold protein YncE
MQLIRKQPLRLATALVGLIEGLIMATAPSVARADGNQPLVLEKSIRLANVEGRIDHMAMDVPGARLFVAALGNNTVEVIDLTSGERVHTIQGLKEPQGVLYLPDVKRLIVANGGDGSCQVFEGQSFELLGTINFGSDADNLRYDPQTKLVYAGFGDGSIAAFDATSLEAAWKVALGGHPESFQVEPTGSQIFANVPTRGEIVVIEKGKKKPIASWPLHDLKSNYPMALDSVNHRLFVGCRNPARLAVFDTNSGNLITAVQIPGDIDDLFYDANRKRLYGSCGEGYLTVFAQVDPDTYRHTADIPTERGARTSIFSSERGEIFLAVPHRGSQQAEIRVYSVG